jgi:hypothetical protein
MALPNGWAGCWLAFFVQSLPPLTVQPSQLLLPCPSGAARVVQRVCGRMHGGTIDRVSGVGKVTYSYRLRRFSDF